MIQKTCKHCGDKLPSRIYVNKKDKIEKEKVLYGNCEKGTCW